MKNKSVKIILVVLCILVFVFGAMFTTDFIRCSTLNAPIFAIQTNIQKDGGSGTYCGIGYLVDVEKHLDAEYGVCIDSVKMWVFGKVIAASVV